LWYSAGRNSRKFVRDDSIVDSIASLSQYLQNQRQYQFSVAGHYQYDGNNNQQRREEERNRREEERKRERRYLGEAHTGSMTCLSCSPVHQILSESEGNAKEDILPHQTHAHTHRHNTHTQVFVDTPVTCAPHSVRFLKIDPFQLLHLCY